MVHIRIMMFVGRCLNVCDTQPKLAAGALIAEFSRDCQKAKHILRTHCNIMSILKT